MKRDPYISILLCLTLLMSLSSPVVASDRDSSAASPALSKKTMTVRVGSSKVLTMKNTSYKVTWSIKSGKSYVKLTNKKKKKVTVVGKAKGTAVVKGVIKYPSGTKKTYTCKVKVKAEQWECPICGFMNTSHYCSNCGYERPTDDGDDTEATATPAASATPTATPAPTADTMAEALSNRVIVMQINSIFYYSLQLYANAGATAFYNGVSNGTIKSFNMGPVGEEEKIAYLTTGLTTYVSSSRYVEKGDVFLYGSYGLKLATTTHETGAHPTRIGRINQNLDTLDRALSQNVDGKTIVEFKLYV